MAFLEEDKLKSLVYREIDRLNPGLLDTNAPEYFRLCTRAYESAKIAIQLQSESSSKKRIRVGKSYSLEEYLNNSLSCFAEGYSQLTKSNQRARDLDAFNFIKQFCGEGLQFTKKFYKFYWRLKNKKD